MQKQKGNSVILLVQLVLKGMVNFHVHGDGTRDELLQVFARISIEMDSCGGKNI